MVALLHNVKKSVSVLEHLAGLFSFRTVGIPSVMKVVIIGPNLKAGLVLSIIRHPAMKG
jgi:hypothetical protein